MTETLLRVEDLRTELGTATGVVRAVDGVSFSVAQGEALGIVGESGSGKSMTAYSIMGLLPPGGSVVGGRVEFDGIDLTSLTPRELRAVRGNQVGMVFQDPLTAINPTMTIGAQIAEPLILHRPEMKPKQVRERVLETMHIVGIPGGADRLRTFPHQLSGGLRQRVAIAIALACQPKLLIADEPTTALDVTIQRQILDLIDKLRAELGMAVILVTHDLGVIAGHTDRVAVMYGGQIVETATTREIFQRAEHRYTEGLFAALPERAVDLEAPLIPIPGSPPDLSGALRGCRFAARCRFVTEACTSADPPVIAVSAGHAHRCIHPVSTKAEATVPITVAAALAPPAQVRATEGVPALVEVTDVYKEYTVRGAGLVASKQKLSAISGVSLRIERGETFGLVGESGCGKSTLARIVTALERPDRGTVRIDGSDLFGAGARELRRRRRDVQLMFQDPAAAMDPRLRAMGILREPFEVQRVGSGAERRAVIGELLDQVGLPRRFAERFPHELSGGQRQRLALARSLALRPQLVVADEPVSALDVSVQAQILNLMKDLQRDRGLGYLFVSHDLSVVRYMATTIGVMYLGKMVETGPSERVYQTPAHPYTRALIDSVPVAEPGAIRPAAVKGDLASAIDPPSGCRFRTRCPLAQERCAVEEPQPRAVPGGGSVACHFPLVDLGMPTVQVAAKQVAG
jgi:peptide/nickel transport system ATP-binding protein